MVGRGTFPQHGCAGLRGTKSEANTMNRYRTIIPSVCLPVLLVALAAASRANDLKQAEPLPAPVPSASPSAPGPSVVIPGEPGKEIPLAGSPCGPCVQYRHRGCPICCDCNAPPEVKTVLIVKNPQDCCCCVGVPVCLPGCCTGEPCVTSRCGVLGRGVVYYDYSCGVRVTITFRARGDIVVTYVHA
jgi:hypothetical protein